MKICIGLVGDLVRSGECAKCVQGKGPLEVGFEGEKEGGVTDALG